MTRNQMIESLLDIYYGDVTDKELKDLFVWHTRAELDDLTDQQLEDEYIEYSELAKLD